MIDFEAIELALFFWCMEYRIMWQHHGWAQNRMARQYCADCFNMGFES